jgi:hypothetical protein
MKKVGCWLTLLAFSGMIGASGAYAAAVKSVVVVNQTSFTLKEFYASPSDSTLDWVTGSGTNLLNGATIGTGGQTVIVIADGTDECVYDLMGVLDGQDNHSYQYQVNACNGDSWTITPGI